MTTQPSVLIAYHGHCFDGMCSAAALTALLREIEPRARDFAYHGLDHQPGGSHVPEDALRGAINAVVDFRYTTSDKLGIWFDHHVTGVVNDTERTHLEAAQRAGAAKYFDPGYGSCCKLIADVAAERYGVRLEGLEEMVHWADIIDAARYPDARTAVELTHPAQQLMTLLEAHGDDAFVSPRVEALTRGATLADLAQQPEAQRLMAPLLEQHERTIGTIRERARFDAGIVYFDLVGSGDDRYNKFIPYFLHPEARYCVAVTAGRSRAKVSVGSNPWAPVPRTHDIAELCARFGGGGHPVVGAVSLPPGEVERARTVAAEIVRALSS